MKSPDAHRAAPPSDPMVGVSLAVCAGLLLAAVFLTSPGLFNLDEAIYVLMVEAAEKR